MKKLMLTFLIALATLSSINVVHAGYIGYTNYLLYANYGNHFTNVHYKSTGDNYISNRVITYVDTTKANFWAVSGTSGNGIRVSPVYAMTAGETMSLKFNKTVNNGDRIQMGMENSSSGEARVSGEVDFR